MALNITPRLAAAPLRNKNDGEAWVDWALEKLAHTRAEIALTADEWVAHFKIPHPGPGYTDTLRVQDARLVEEIEGTLSALGTKNPDRSDDRAEFLMNVFSTALEGGIGYWSVARRYRWQKGPKEARTDDTRGFYAIVEPDDGEECDDFCAPRVIDASVIARGLARLTKGDVKGTNAACAALVAKANKKTKYGYDEDTLIDADVADTIVQAGLFNEVVFG